jgi:hypothetical protein
MEEEARFTLRLPILVRDELALIAKCQDRSVNGQIVWALKEWLSQRRAAQAPPAMPPGEERPDGY